MTGRSLILCPAPGCDDVLRPLGDGLIACGFCGYTEVNRTTEAGATGLLDRVTSDEPRVRTSVDEADISRSGSPHR